jgi:hypothetical protein
LMGRKAAQMSDISRLSTEMFSDELADIEAEREKTEALFGQLKTHFDGMISPNARGQQLDFLARQAENLITLRKNAQDLIKQRMSVKKLAVDVDVKWRALEHKLGAGQATAGILEVYRLIVAGGGDPKAIMAAAIMVEHDDLVDADGVIDRLIGGDVIDAEFEEVKPDEPEPDGMPPGWSVVCGTNGIAYVVDADYEIQTGWDTSEYAPVSWQDAEGTWQALDSQGNAMEVVDVGADAPEEE